MSPMSRAIWLLARLGAEAEQQETAEGVTGSEAVTPSAADQPAQEEQINLEDTL